MKRSVHVSNIVLTFGCTTNEPFSIAPRYGFKPERIYSNAPCEGGAFYLLFTYPNGEVRRYDLSVAANHTQPVDWPYFEKGQEVKFEIWAPGIVPRGYVCGMRFSLTITIEGVELP